MRAHTILRFLFIAALAVPAGTRAESDASFNQWLVNFQSDARQAGISQSVLDKAFADVEPIDRVIELDHAQPEVKYTLAQYLHHVISQQKINMGRRLYKENRSLLEDVAAKYDVQPKYIVALWGIESNFGNNTGGFDIIPALATLAYDGRRSSYFRAELLNALRIAQTENINPAEMTGSWAGAMGQCQFMPTSFLRYAVDYSGDGKRDIWTNRADVFASIANYLHTEGWNGTEGLGSPDEKHSNFNVILKWNRSRYFATAVGKLADAVQED